MIDLSRFKIIIFDFDGVIIDSEAPSARAWSQVARELGMADCEIHPSRCAGRLDIEVAPELFPHVPDPMECAKRKWAIEAEWEAAGLFQPIGGVVDFIGRMRRSHTLAVCSSSRLDQVSERLDQFKLRDCFAIVTGRTEGVAHKPAPDLYLRTLAALKIEASEACAIEDSVTGVAAAKAAGIFTIQLLHEGMPRAENADAHIRSFNELKS